MMIRPTPCLPCLLLLAAALGGCAYSETVERGSPGTSYRPTAVSYAIPPTAPRGYVYVSSLGPEPLLVGSNQTAPYLRVHLAAQNDSDDAVWRFDPNEQLVRYQTGQPVRPSYAETSAGGPVLTLARGQRGHLDVYYQLPAGASAASTSLEWRVHRGAEVVANNIVFQPVAVNPGYVYYQPRYQPYVGVDLMFGPGWWWGHHPYWWGSHAYYHPYYWGPRYYYPYPRAYYPPSYRAWPRGYASPAAPATVPRSAPAHTGKSGWRYQPR